ncbi:hypothetical protein B0T24DRAFT_681828 [Lasiosphaeria ovina]|uniref:NB-ARC domain-containing protein n=1 Tax=Lasiosphaeria ovina TaxID=92902 RepID=A0AAE0N0S0_9PEZI|nr:hypothetical protein B0T24DRAFT_681828 [Lasiosphaeria ovina]
MATAEVQDELAQLALSRLERDSVAAGSNCSSNRGPNPSISAHDYGDSHQANSGDLCSERWTEALRRCKEGLTARDYEIVGQFDSYDKLLSGLDNLHLPQQSGSAAARPGVSRLIFQVRDTVTPFRHVLVMFAMVMMPQTVATGIFWGLIYLVIESAARQDNAARNIAEMLSKIRRQLALLIKYSSTIKNNPEIGEDDKSEFKIVFIEILEALIYFWRDCVSFYGKFPPARFQPKDTKEWHNMEKSFANTMKEIDEAMVHLISFLGPTNGAPALRIGSAQQHSQAQEQQQEPNVFPIRQLPDTQTAIFIGRADILEDMSTYLQRPPQSRDDLAIYALCGMGGVGKTELAREYAYRHKHEFDAVFWVGAEQAESLRNAFTAIAVELHLEGAKIDGDPIHNLRLVHRWFRVTDRKWLVILDNVEKHSDVENYLPLDASRGSFIVTTRYVDQARFFKRHLKEVSKLTTPQAENLFLNLLFPQQQQESWSGHDNVTTAEAHLGDEDKAAVQYLLKDMDGLVLGIHQMATLIRYQDLTRDITKFCNRYKKHLPRLLKKQEGIKGHTLATLWAMTFKSVRARPDAWIMLGVLCCVQPDSIPKELFLPDDTEITTGRLAFCADEFDVDEEIDFLKGVGLVERRGDNTLSLHRLVQVAFLFLLERDEAQIMFNHASTLVNFFFPKQIKGRQLFEQRSVCQRWAQHGQTLSDLFERLGAVGMPLQHTPAFVELMTNCAWYMHEVGNWRDTLGLIRIALSACEGKDDLARAHLLNTASQTHFYLNDTVECRKAVAESRRLREELCDPNDEELANTYLNYGNLEGAEGRQDEAIQYFEKSISIRKNIRGAEVMVGVCYLTIARALWNKVEYEGCDKYLDLSQSVFEEHLGKSAYNVLYVHYLRGNLQLSRGELKEAKASYNACLAKLLEDTPSDPKVSTVYFKIGTADFRLGNLLAALEALSKGLAITRLRGVDGRGEEARILRREAQVLEVAMPLNAGSPLLELADMADPQLLHGTADQLRRRLEGDKFRVYLTQEEEEAAFDMLLGAFDR